MKKLKLEVDFFSIVQDIEEHLQNDVSSKNIGSISEARINQRTVSNKSFLKSRKSGKASKFIKKKKEHNESIDSESSSSSEQAEIIPQPKNQGEGSNSSVISVTSDAKQGEEEERSIYSEIVKMTKHEGRSNGGGDDSEKKTIDYARMSGQYQKKSTFNFQGDELNKMKKINIEILKERRDNRFSEQIDDPMQGLKENGELIAKRKRFESHQHNDKSKGQDKDETFIKKKTMKRNTVKGHNSDDSSTYRRKDSMSVSTQKSKLERSKSYKKQERDYEKEIKEFSKKVSKGTKKVKDIIESHYQKRDQQQRASGKIVGEGRTNSKKSSSNSNHFQKRQIINIKSINFDKSQSNKQSQEQSISQQTGTATEKQKNEQPLEEKPENQNPLLIKENQQEQDATNNKPGYNSDYLSHSSDDDFEDETRGSHTKVNVKAIVNTKQKHRANGFTPMKYEQSNQVAYQSVASSQKKKTNGIKTAFQQILPSSYQLGKLKKI